MKLVLFLIFSIFLSANEIVSYTTDAKNIKMFHADKSGKVFGNFANLKAYLKEQNATLKFAMNGGMYLKNLSPQGLYIENGKLIKSINLKHNSYGNFYMQPNGVFYITKDGNASVVKSREFKFDKNIEYATQSGPMLVIDGKINPKFNPNSKSFYIRNGVGVLPNGTLLFAISKEPIRFYDFANFFKKAGCRDALYLDGFVSRIYLPSEGITKQDFIFGIIIAELKGNG